MTVAPADAAMRAVSSVEQSSMTSISSGGVVWVSNDRTVSPIDSASFQAGTNTVSGRVRLSRLGDFNGRRNIAAKVSVTRSSFDLVPVPANSS